jgi:hypothetical protein
MVRRIILTDALIGTAMQIFQYQYFCVRSNPLTSQYKQAGRLQLKGTLETRSKKNYRFRLFLE